MAAPSDWRFDGVVRLTGIGTAYLIATIVVGFAAINTGNNALYIGLTVMLGCLVLSGLASKGGLKHIDVELGGADEAWAGRRAWGSLRIHNRSGIWNVRDAIVTSPDIDRPIFVPMLARHATVEAQGDFLFPRRGIVQINFVDLYTRYPFGFFLKKRRVRIGGEVVVYPRLLDEAAVRQRFRAVEGELYASNRPGIGTDIYSFRDYVRGDSPRHVYWKKSASLGRWITKQTELEAGRAVHVAIDPYKPRGVSDDAFEEMVSAAATFIVDAIDRGLDVLVTMPRINLQAGPQQTARPIYRALALLEPSHEPVAQPLDRGTVLFSVGDADEQKSA